MRTKPPVIIDKDALSRLVEYCDSNHMDHLVLVADQNTYQALGQAVEDTLNSRRFDVQTIVLTGEEVLANEHYIMQVFIRLDGTERVYLAVGSGTITDITRFVSHRTQSAFISVPTAPSVDGFTSIVAPLVIEGVKMTATAQPPIAVFADLNALCAAPQRMIASGFGDLLGKYTSLADWKLGHLLWGEPYSEPIERRVRKALRDCVGCVDEIGQSSEEGVRRLMDGLIESGFCMVDFGDSQPASGAEHHLSHYWEMKLLRENRPAILHGAKVGIGAILAARYFEKIRHMTQEQLFERIETAKLPDRNREIKHIKTCHGPIAGQLMANQAPFLDMSEGAFMLLKQRIIDNWSEVQDIANTVPAAEAITDMLQRVGSPVEPGALGLNDEDVSMALGCAHYLRARFTVMKLGAMFNLW